MTHITLSIPSHNTVIKLNYETEHQIYIILVNDVDVLAKTNIKNEALARFDTIVSLLNLLKIHCELEYHI